MIRWKSLLPRSARSVPLARSAERSSEPWTGMTCADLLARWDAGETVWTCRMSDIGTAYEQAIHDIGMEVMRAMLADPLDFRAMARGGDEKKFAIWRDYSRKILAVPAVSTTVAREAPEELQLSAALNVSSMFVRNGYAPEMDKLPPEHRIRVARSAAAAPA